MQSKNRVCYYGDKNNTSCHEDANTTCVTMEWTYKQYVRYYGDKNNTSVAMERQTPWVWLLLWRIQAARALLCQPKSICVLVPNVVLYL